MCRWNARRGRWRQCGQSCCPSAGGCDNSASRAGQNTAYCLPNCLFRTVVPKHPMLLPSTRCRAPPGRPSSSQIIRPQNHGPMTKREPVGLGPARTSAPGQERHPALSSSLCRVHCPRHRAKDVGRRHGMCSGSHDIMILRLKVDRPPTHIRSGVSVRHQCAKQEKPARKQDCAAARRSISTMRPMTMRPRCRTDRVWGVPCF